MEKIPRKTGEFGVGLMIHCVHMTDDVPPLRRFYEEVFAGLVYMGVDEPHYWDIEDRWACLLQVSDLCIEAMAPNLPPNLAKPVGRFYSKFGRHLHSVGYKVDDLVGIGNHLIAQGMYIGAPGGGKLEQIDPETPYFYPSPRGMHGLMVEFCRTDMPNDPRFLESWSSQMNMWSIGHPLGIKRLAYITLGVEDIEAGVDTYVNTLQAVPVTDGVEPSDGSRFAMLQLGDCLLQLAEPMDPGSPLGRHVDRWGSMIYGITFSVRELDATEEWLAKRDVRTTRLREGLTAADPDDCFGAPYFFTTDSIPGGTLDSFSDHESVAIHGGQSR